MSQLRFNISLIPLEHHLSTAIQTIHRVWHHQARPICDPAQLTMQPVHVSNKANNQ